MSRSAFRRALSPLVGALLLLQAAVVPALEATDAGPRVVLESRHDASCRVGHDHSICTQAGANRSIVSGSATAVLAAATVEIAAPLGVGQPPARAVERGSRPRAPPTI